VLLVVVEGKPEEALDIEDAVRRVRPVPVPAGLISPFTVASVRARAARKTATNSSIDASS
jgi:hypothetical protein